MTGIDGTQTENPNKGTSEDISMGDLDWLDKQEDLEDLDESDESPESSDLKEDIPTFQARIVRLDWDGLLNEFTRFTNLKSTYNALTALIEKVEDERSRSIPQLDRVKTLNPDIQETIVKVKRLCKNILLKYEKANPEYPMIKEINGEPKILQNLYDHTYQSWGIRYGGEEAKLLKLFTGYALKNIENRIEYKKLKEELKPTRKKEKWGLGEKVIGGLEALVFIGSNLAHAFNLIDTNINYSIMVGLGVTAISSLGYCEYRKSEISKKYDEIYENKENIGEDFIDDYFDEQIRAEEASIGV